MLELLAVLLLLAFFGHWIVILFFVTAFSFGHVLIQIGLIAGGVYLGKLLYDEYKATPQ